MTHDLGSHKTDSTDVQVAVFSAKTKSRTEMQTYRVTVENRHLAPVFLQQHGKYVSRRRFPRATETRKPDTYSLFMTWRICLSQYFRNLWTREPGWQRSASLKELLP